MAKGKSQLPKQHCLLDGINTTNTYRKIKLTLIKMKQPIVMKMFTFHKISLGKSELDHTLKNRGILKHR